MQTRTKPPLARKSELVVEELGDELLVYDLTRNEAHSLGALAARVWRACDGETTPDEMSTKLGVGPDAIAEAVAGLATCHLLDAAADDEIGLTRRGLTLRA